MNSKLTFRSLIPTLAIFLAAVTSARAAEPMTRLDSRSGSKMRLEGTSSVHDWQAESPLISGFLEVGPNFPLEPGQTVTPGKVEARGQASVTVLSIISVKKNGDHYDNTMDEKMYSMFKQTNNPAIVFRLTELVLKEVAKDKSSPYVFDAKGDLAIAGVTNNISLTVNVLPLGNKKVKISGTKALKMSDFKIDPATILFAKTGDDVTVKFDWILGETKSASTPAAK